MPWYIAASLLSNVCIIWIEHVNRGAVGGWVSALPQTWLPIIMAQWCLFHAFNGAPHWLTAWLVFVIGNSIMRVAAVNLSAGHEVTSWNLVLLGIAVVLGGSLIVKEGLR